MATLTLTPYSDLAPVPRVGVVIRDADDLGDAVNVYASTEAGRRLVRGGAATPAASLIVLDDFEAPFNVPVTYTIQVLDAGGAEVATLVEVAPALVYYGTVVQHVIDARRAVEVRLLAGSERSLEWSHDGELVRPGASRLPTWLGSGSWPLQGIPLAFGTESAEQYAAMRGVVGLDVDDGADYLPILVVRTSHPVHWPQPLTVLVQTMRKSGLDWLAGGDSTHWHMTGDMVRPPAAALVRPAVTWDDVRAAFTTWDEVRAAYATWSELMLDRTLAGGSDA